MNTLYKPISCSLYDKLEAFATGQITVEITVGQQIIRDIIVDVFSKDQAEFIRLKNGDIIRLDKIEKLNGELISLIC